MKTKLTLLTICLIFISSFSFAQKKNEAQSIIKNKVNIKKYHTHEELDNMQKGELITLYMERIQALSGTDEYLENTLEFQRKLLPYSDTKKIAKAVFFYEEIMKSIHAYDEFN